MNKLRDRERILANQWQYADKSHLSRSKWWSSIVGFGWSRKRARVYALQVGRTYHLNWYNQLQSLSAIQVDPRLLGQGGQKERRKGIDQRRHGDPLGSILLVCKVPSKARRVF